MTEENVDLLADIETRLVQASAGKRFLNYIIDLVVFYVIIFVLGFVFAIIAPSTIELFEANDIWTQLLSRLIALLMYGIIMGFLEALFKGRTLGKLITGTKVVNADGSTISASTAFQRGLSRAVPFEVFSALGSPSYPWHDEWTKTYVIDLKESIVKTEVAPVTAR